VGLYEITFYEDANGVRPVQDYILKLGLKKGKDSRIKFNKIQDEEGRFYTSSPFHEGNAKNAAKRNINCQNAFAGS
jgi:phage-related protein